MRDEPPEDTFSSGRAHRRRWFPQGYNTFHGAESLELEVAGFIAERQAVGQVAIRTGAVNGNGVDVRLHGPSGEVHQREKNFRAFVVATAGRAAARIPKGLLAFFLPRGSVAKTVEGLKLHDLMGVAVWRDHIINGENLERVPPPNIWNDGIFEIGLVQKNGLRGQGKEIDDWRASEPQGSCRNVEIKQTTSTRGPKPAFSRASRPVRSRKKNFSGKLKYSCRRR